MEAVSDIDRLLPKIQRLSDLDLALLLCFVAGQHGCIIEADAKLLPDVETELESVYNQCPFSVYFFS
jgi:hypothetical protein